MMAKHVLFQAFAAFLIYLPASLRAGEIDRIDLSGFWRFQADPMAFGKTPGSELYLSKLTETIRLPGSTDEAGKGVLNTAAHVDRLSRRFEYCGAAWYQREVVIPQAWNGREIVLELERCHWETAVYVDGKPAGVDERLSTPNRFVLTDRLTPGVHTLTLCVDNRLKYPMDHWNHGTTEHTQTNWNGIVGEIALKAYSPSSFQHTRITTRDDEVEARFVFRVARPVAGRVEIEIEGPDGAIVHRSACRKTLSGPADTLTLNLKLTRAAERWDEFAQPIYTLRAVLDAEGERDTCSTPFGFRTVEQGRHHVRINGRDIHLRGVLDCAVFPKTGYPSTDPQEWERIFRTVREYGMNHVRFHSWCPPRAAFEAADRIGLYLQVELPMWIKDVGRYPARRDFFEREMFAILDEYGNHPSFVLFCNGNENEGDFAVLEDLVKKARAYDPRRLYSASTARTHVESDQFYVSHVSSKGWITVYEGRPSTDWDLAEASDIDVPVIAHETGQRCMYPDFGEMERYDGVLEPRNFHLFRERLARNGMLHQADDFFRATGAHTVLQYKEVNEALLRTANSGGFQLLGLADFPGQGSAFVGILNPFWESKGLVEPERFRESCGPRVLLARFPKRVYGNSERFPVKFQLYHYGERTLPRGRLSWKLVDETQRVVVAGKLKHGAVRPSSVDSLAFVEVPLNSIDSAGKYTLHASLEDGLHNEWDIWVYPEEARTARQPEYLRLSDWNEARQALAEGKSVLFVPEKTNGRKTRFTGHFWNPVMFDWAPMIVGTLIDHDHPAFTDFPTSYYADWQWTDVLNHATALDLTGFDGLTPVIQSIDTYEVNRKLGVAFEAQVGAGRLFVLCVDDRTDVENRPATRQLLHSVGRYVASEAFRPAAEVSVSRLDALFGSSGDGEAESDAEAQEAIRQLLNQ